MEKKNRLPLVFFWSIGLVCINPIVGAQGFSFQEIAEAAFLSGKDAPAEPVAEATGEQEAFPVDEAEIPDDSAEVAAEDAELPDGQTVKVGSFGQIDLHVKDLAVSKVLQLLSIQAQKNIIATKDVSGSISADLYDVDFYDALDAILHPNGFGYQEKGNFIFVDTKSNIEQAIAATQKPVVHVHRLNYLNSADASTYVTPLLSASGSISVSGDVSPGFTPSNDGAGENTNALGDILVIRDFQENVDEMLAVVSQLDVRPKQVMVEAVILETRLTEANALGVDINAIIDLDAADFANPVGGVVDDVLNNNGPAAGQDGQVIQITPGSVATGQSGMKIGFLGSNVNVFVRALDKVTDTTVIAKPKLLALNRQPADLLVGQRLGYISTTANETSTTETVEFLEIGTQLSFRAFIGDDDFVRLELRPSISDGSTSLVGGFVVPNETTNEMTTNVIVRDGQTVVLGGLFKEDTDVSRNQVPFLGDVPFLGAGFRGQDDDFQRSEVIFMIKPTIVKDEVLTRIGETAMDNTRIRRASAKRELLPWSREKQSTNYLHRAMAHKKEGNTRKALWNANMALELDPTFVKAIRLKQELTGEAFHISDRSLLEDAVNHMVTDKVGELDEFLQEVRSSDDPFVNGEEIETFDIEQSTEATAATEEGAEEAEGEQWLELDTQETTEPEETELATQPLSNADTEDEPFEISEEEFESVDVIEVLEATADATDEAATDEPLESESDGQVADVPTDTTE